MNEHTEHNECLECAPLARKWEKDDEPNHDNCTNRCPGYYAPGVLVAVECSGPCGCECAKPLSRNEIMELRDLVDRLRR